MNPLIRKLIDEAKEQKRKPQDIKNALGYALGSCISIPDNYTYKTTNLIFTMEEEKIFTENFWRFIEENFEDNIFHG